MQNRTGSSGVGKGKKKRRRQVDNSYTANYVSPFSFKRIYEATNINNLETSLDIHKYISLIHDICLDNIYTSTQVEPGRGGVLKKTFDEIVNMMVTRGGDIKSGYTNKESEKWSLLMFTFVSLASLSCFMMEDFVTEYSLAAKRMPEMYSVNSTKNINKMKLSNKIASLGRSSNSMQIITLAQRKKHKNV